MENTLRENKMGTMPIRKLLLNMAAPMVVSMLLQAFYNIVDSIFVSYICEEALTAVSLSFPIQTMLIATGTGTGVGINAMLSKALGEKDYDSANRAARNGIFLAACSYLLFLVIGLTFSRKFFEIQTSDPLIIEYGTQYLSVVTVFSFGIFTQLCFERLLQATGKTFQSMLIQGSGAIINIIFDPILIFGLLGFPALGVTGAAIATVFGQIVAGALAVILNKKKNHELNCSMKGFRPHLKTIGRIYSVGVPSIVMQAVGSVMYFTFNSILLTFGTSTYSAVFGVYFKLQSIFFMPIFGMNNGMIPIIAYNYGAKKRSRITHVIRLGIIWAVALMVVGMALFHLIPGSLLRLFDASENMQHIGIHALRIASISYLFAGYCIVTGCVFQALGNGVYSLYVSIMRKLVVLLPVAFLLAKTAGIDSVWWSFPIAEIMSLTVSTVLLIRIYRKIIKPLPDLV